MGEAVSEPIVCNECHGEGFILETDGSLNFQRCSICNVGEDVGEIARLTALLAAERQRAAAWCQRATVAEKWIDALRTALDMATTRADRAEARRDDYEKRGDAHLNASEYFEAEMVAAIGRAEKAEYRASDLMFAVARYFTTIEDARRTSRAWKRLAQKYLEELRLGEDISVPPGSPIQKLYDEHRRLAESLFNDGDTPETRAALNAVRAKLDEVQHEMMWPDWNRMGLEMKNLRILGLETAMVRILLVAKTLEEAQAIAQEAASGKGE